MYIFLPNAFFSLRAYDPERGGREVPYPESYVTARAHADQDMQVLREFLDGRYGGYSIGKPRTWETEGTDYPYHLHLPAWIFSEFVDNQLRNLNQMKGSGNDDIREYVHSMVNNNAQLLQELNDAHS